MALVVRGETKFLEMKKTMTKRKGEEEVASSRNSRANFYVVEFTGRGSCIHRARCGGS